MLVLLPWLEVVLPEFWHFPKEFPKYPKLSLLLLLNILVSHNFASKL